MRVRYASANAAAQEDHEQAVGPRIAHEVERREGRDAGIDLHLLDPEQDERRPDEVEQLRGDEERAERRARRGALGREGDGEVTDEHGGACARRAPHRRRAGSPVARPPVLGRLGLRDAGPLLHRQHVEALAQGGGVGLGEVAVAAALPLPPLDRVRRGDGGGHRDVERLDEAAHGDGVLRVGARQRLLGDAAVLVAEDERHLAGERELRRARRDPGPRWVA